MDAKTMFSGQRDGEVAVSADEVSIVLPKKKNVQVSARIPGEDYEKLLHVIEQLKAFSRAQKQGRETLDGITESFVLRDIIAAGLDVTLSRFQGYPKTPEAKAAQLELIESGKMRPQQLPDESDDSKH